jgi:hypothetical protein
LARYPVKSAPETSRLLLDAPALLVDEFLCSRNLSDVLGETIERIALATTEQEGRSERLATALQALSSDRLQHVEAQARRIAALSEPAASHLLLGLAEANLGGMEAEFSSQRDALARSLWCYVRRSTCSRMPSGRSSSTTTAITENSTRHTIWRRRCQLRLKRSIASVSPKRSRRECTWMRSAQLTLSIYRRSRVR